MKELVRVAIDGPSGAGKSTVAKAVAASLEIDYIDTGAMYRAIGYKIKQTGLRAESSEALRQMLQETEIDFVRGDIILDGAVVNDKIRTSEISQLASLCSALPEVRQKLVELQQKMGETKSVIMDGRDIGNHVLPNAEHKFFVTAAPEERARRRYDELCEKGEQVSYEQVLADIVRRDTQDMTRKLNPLRKAEDAEELDTTNMSVEEVVDYILKEVNQSWQQ